LRDFLFLHVCNSNLAALYLNFNKSIQLAHPDLNYTNMPKCVHMGAKIKCSFGAGPKDMVVLPLAMTMNASKALAAQMDFVPMLNIPAFGQCKSPMNPMNWKMVGPVPVFVPSSCIPVTVAPWSPVAKKLKIGGFPAMLDTSKTMCIWMGSITVDKPGVTNVEAK
jgi:hypothetical protein